MANTSGLPRCRISHIADVSSNYPPARLTVSKKGRDLLGRRVVLELIEGRIAVRGVLEGAECPGAITLGRDGSARADWWFWVRRIHPKQVEGEYVLVPEAHWPMRCYLQ